MDANDPRAERFKKAVESADAGEIRRLFDAHPELELGHDGLAELLR